MRRRLLMEFICAGFLLAMIFPASGKAPYLSVFDNGLTDVETPVEQARLLKSLGYDGICTRPERGTTEFMAAFDAEGVDIAATYLVLPPETESVPSNVVRYIESLKGRDTIVWFALGLGDTTQSNAVSLIHQVCDAAGRADLEVVLYPHANFYTDTVKKVSELCRAADRDNLGISFNLCHFLAQNDQADVEKTLRAVAPDLRLVQLSGANMLPPDKPDWSQLIFPLGEGSFDMRRVLDTLQEVGYTGPFNIQCHQIKQPASKHLKASMDAWRTYYE